MGFSSEQNINNKRKIIQNDHQNDKRKKVLNLEPSDLNGHGIALLLTGNTEEAEKSFKLALRRHIMMGSDKIIQSRIIQQIKNYSCTDSGVCEGIWEKEFPSSTILQISDISDALTQLPSRNQIQQEYDEGMCPDSDVMAWDESDSKTDQSIKTAILLYNIGQTYRHRKHFKEAQKWFGMSVTYLKQTNKEQLTEKRIEILVQSLHFLGMCKYRERQYDEAIKCYESALQYLNTQTCTFHPKNNRLMAITKNALALTLFYSSIKITSNLHGPNENNQSHIKDANIVNFFEESIEIYRQLSGNYQRNIATVMNNMGRVYYLRGNYTSAMKNYEAALKIRRSIYPNDSIDLAVSVCNLGQTYHQLGLMDDAMRLLQEFLDLMQYHTANRSSQRDVSIVTACIATIYYERGELNEARKMYEKALYSTKRADYSCICQSQKASILNKLGSICYKLKDLSLALEYLTEGFNTEVKLYGMNHPNVVVTLLNIAQIHRDQSDFSSALLRYSQVYSIQIAMDGHITHAAATTLFSMGLMLYRMKEYTLAFDKYQDALLIQGILYEKDLDNEDIASTLNSIGIVLFHLGKVEMAKTYFQESLRIRKKVLGHVHQDVATNLYNLATLHLELGNDVTAIQMFKETLEIERTTKGCESQDYIQTLNHLGILYQRNGDLDEALKYFNLSLGIERTQKDHNQIAIARLLNLIGNIHLQTANVAEMMKCFIEASQIYGYNKTNKVEKNHTGNTHSSTDKLVIVGLSMYELSKLHPECAEAV